MEFHEDSLWTNDIFLKPYDPNESSSHVLGTNNALAELYCLFPDFNNITYITDK